MVRNAHKFSTHRHDLEGSKGSKLNTNSVLSPQSSVLTISASEIGEYEYCARAWWYRHVVRLAPPQRSDAAGRFSRGKAAHHYHGRRVARATLLRSLGIGLALAGSLIIIATLLVTLL
jgi:hypothetical protein